MKVTEHNYDHLLVDLNLMTLANRRIFLSLSFLHNILSGVIAYYLNVYDCIAAKTLRLNLLFHLEQHRTSYGAFKLLNRLCALTNDSSDRVDFFNTSLNLFKTISAPPSFLILIIFLFCLCYVYFILFFS